MTCRNLSRNGERKDDLLSKWRKPFPADGTVRKKTEAWEIDAWIVSKLWK